LNNILNFKAQPLENLLVEHIISELYNPLRQSFQPHLWRSMRYISAEPTWTTSVKDKRKERWTSGILFASVFNLNTLINLVHPDKVHQHSQFSKIGSEKSATIASLWMQGVSPI
jgi:hypothetical protein